MHFFKLKVSTFFILLLALLHLFAVCVLFKLPLQLLFKVPLLCLIMASGIHAFKKALKLKAFSIRKLACFCDQPWVVEFNNKEKQAVIVLSHSIVTRYFMCLYLQPLTEEVSVIPLFIWFDSIERDEHRCIRRALALNQ